MEALSRDLRVLIVAEHASVRFGGEAALPLHYYRVLRSRRIPTWLVAHERTARELEALFPGDRESMAFVSDTVWHRLLWKLSAVLPVRLAGFTAGFLMRVITQIAQRRVVRRLVRQHRICVIHQPIPVSPKEPSLMFGLGAPVVIGPLNGGMDYPSAFRGLQGRFERGAISAARALAPVLNALLPGKRLASVIVVANERTRNALPCETAARIEELVENGVDLGLWSPAPRRTPPAQPDPTHFVFIGRLVRMKGVDLLLHAFQRAARSACITLTVIGDGPERERLESLADSLGIRVAFLGWMPQARCAQELRASHALVLPSLMECGGAVVLEAMAMQVPVIAAAWGGPADYVDSSCGILIEPTSRAQFIEELSFAMLRLSQHPDERAAMGRAARARVIERFDWDVKVDRMLKIYRRAIEAVEPEAARH